MSTTRKNVEVWSTGPDGARARLNEFRSDNAGVGGHDDYERLMAHATRVVGGWSKVFPDDKIEIVLVSRTAARRAQRSSPIGRDRLPS